MIGISTQFIRILPYMMQNRWSEVWDRLVESGIDNHIKRQNVEFYKTIRSDWFYRDYLNNAFNEMVDQKEGRTSALMLFFVVLVFGHGLAVFAFLLELMGVQLWCHFD